MILTSCARNVRLQRVPRVQDLGCRRTEKTHKECVGRSESLCHCTRCWRVAPASTRLRSHWRRIFRGYNVKIMWFTTCFGHFFRFPKLPKVVLARISGWVGTACTVLLCVYFGTCLPIFIEIGSHLTDIEQMKSRCIFETWCIYKKDNSPVVNLW